MTSIPLASEPNSQASASPIRWQFELRHLVYATALIGAGVATFGWIGSLVAVGVLAGWGLLCYLAAEWHLRAVAVSAVAATVFGLVAWQLGCLPWPFRDADTLRSQDQLRRIGAGLLAYQQREGELPPIYLTDRENWPIHSWRALLLRDLGEAELARAYDYRDAWESQRSKLFDRATPQPYSGACWSGTSFVAIGHDGRFHNADGSARSIMVVDTNLTFTFWLAPRDLRIDEAIAVISQGRRREEGTFLREKTAWTNVLLSDGTVVAQPAVPLSVAERLVKTGYTPEDVAACNAWGAWRQDNCLRLAMLVLLAFLPVPWVLIFAGDSATAR